MSATNKQNAAKKKHHHRTGSSGYLVARPKWAKTENDLVDKGIKAETINWPDRCRTWFFGAGGTLDPVSRKCRWMDEQLKIPVTKLRQVVCCDLLLVPLAPLPFRAAPAVGPAPVSSSSLGFCNPLRPENQPSTEWSLVCLVFIQGAQDSRGPL